MRPFSVFLSITLCLVSRVVQGVVLSTTRRLFPSFYLESRSRSTAAYRGYSSVALRSNEDADFGEMRGLNETGQFSHLVESGPFDDPDTPRSKQNLPPMPSVEPARLRPYNSKLNPYNIPTDPDEEWEWFFAKLKARNEDGATFNAVEESLLRNWMATNRKMFMKTLGILDLGAQCNWGTEYLNEERKQRLDDIGFYFGHLQPPSLKNEQIYSQEFQRKVRIRYKDWMWNAMYDQLCLHCKKHDSSNTPLSDRRGLGVWCARQRLIRWKMPKRRRQRLDEINFQWDWKDKSTPFASNPTRLKGGAPKEPKRKSKTMHFPTRLAQLKEYRISNGDCNVPIDAENGLGKWVKLMKGRKSSLSLRSVVKLEKLGFEFDPEEPDANRI